MFVKAMVNVKTLKRSRPHACYMQKDRANKEQRNLNYFKQICSPVLKSVKAMAQK